MSSQSSSSSECRTVLPYDPSLPLAATALGLYAVVTGLHVMRMVMTRTWDNIFMVLGGICKYHPLAARSAA